MKLLILVFAICTAYYSHANMTSLPNGKFLGNGKWDSKSGERGVYQTFVEINNNNFQTNYFFDNKVDNTTFSFVFKKDSWFNIYHKNNIIGEGFCLDFQCNYWINLENNTYSETLTFYKDNIYRIGFRKTPNNTYKWDEVLSPQKPISNPPFLPIIPQGITFLSSIKNILPTLPINPPSVPILPILDIKELAHYLGVGNWSDKRGNNGEYHILYGLNSERLLTSTIWQLSSTYFALDFKFNRDWFNVLNLNKIIGNGFCSRYQCQYIVESEKEIFVETFTLYENKFHRSGYRNKKEGFTIRWDELSYSIDKVMPNINLPFMPK